MNAKNTSHQGSFNIGAGLQTAGASSGERQKIATSDVVRSGEPANLTSSHKGLRGAPYKTFDKEGVPSIGAANMTAVQKV